MRLNHKFVRQDFDPLSKISPMISELIEVEKEFKITRRELLSIAGTLGSISILDTIFLGSAQIDFKPDRAVFSMFGEKRWEIDTRRFSGKPRLCITHSSGQILIKLSGARYPGTLLQADLTCRLKPTLSGWRMHLAMAGGLNTTIPLEKWLLGMVRAKGKTSTVQKIGRSPGIIQGSVSKNIPYWFHSDWSVTYLGSNASEIKLPGANISTDKLTVRLGSPNSASLLEHAPKRKTVLEPEVNENCCFKPVSGGQTNWRFTKTITDFKQLRVELAESTQGRIYGGFLAEAPDMKEPVLMQPSPALCSSSGRPSSIALAGLRYAAAFDGNKTQSLFSAKIDEQPRWLQAGQYSVMLAGSNKMHRFELELMNGKISRVSCNAALVGSILPPGGNRVIARPVGAYPGETLRILYGKRMPGNERNENTLLIPPAGSSPPRLRLANARVEMIRPDDLVVLGFEFINMELIEGTFRQARYLQPTGSGQAYMVIYHQPQNIAEQAFLEAAQSALGDDANLGEPLQLPPVRARYAGESRVVVKIPAGETIPYTLEGLLKAAGEHELSVPPNALPPPVYQIAASVFTPLTEALDLADIQYQLSGVTDVRGLTIEQGVIEYSTIASLRGSALTAQDRRMVRTRPDTPTVTQLIRSHRDMEVGNRSILAAVINIPPGISGDLITPPDPPEPAPPLNHHTALEIPFRLIISPHAGEGWAHSAEPVLSPKTGRVELWHSRLGIRMARNIINDRHPNRTIRAVWYGDSRADSLKQQMSSVPESGDDPFRMSLSPLDRHNLVHLSSNFNVSGFTPSPVSVRNLMLSSLGGWIDVRGAWDPPGDLSVEEWIHRGTLGRDHYVKVVYAGNLFPFGHRASLVKVTERKIHAHPEQSNVPVAYLRQRFFIIVREPLVFKALGNSPRDRQMPFKSIEITSLATPILDDPADSALLPGDPIRMFWPRVGGQDFQFNLRMEDTEGHTTEITMPLAFVMQGTSQNQVNTLIGNFNVNGPSDRRTRPFAGQKVSLAASDLPGDTDFEVETLTFHAENVAHGLGYEPIMHEAELHIPALTQMAGIDLTRTHFHPAYIEHGFAASGNEGQVLLEMEQDEIKDLNFEGKGDRSGGFVQPNMSVTGISRTLGPVGGDLETAVGGDFNPDKYFGGGDEGNPDFQSAYSPKLFGVIDLWDIIDIAKVAEKEKIPTMHSEALDLVERFVKDLNDARLVADRLAAEGISGAAQASNTASDVYSSIESFLSNPASFNAGSLQGQISQLQDQFAGVKQQLTPQNLQVESLRREAERTIRLVLEMIDTSAKITEILTRVEDFINAVELAKQMRVRLEWKPDVKNWPSENPIFVATNDKTGRDASFVLAVEMQAQQENVNGSGGAGFEVMCCLDHFTVDLIGSTTFIRLYFKKMAFFARTGQKAGVDVDFQGLEFAGPLSFIERLRALIPLDGFSDPPFVDVDEKGITAGFDFEIPTVGMGVFTLQNVVLGAKLNIPFIGDPLSITFFFNTRENPCSVTVYGIGGGAYVGITVNMQGLQAMEAAIEFGGSVAFNVVVASGSVHIFAGIFFRLEKQGDVTIIELAGYLRLGGKVKVLGLIGISIELRMELAYQVQVGQLVGKVIGRASLEVKVELLFFETGVTITVERKFSPKNDDPTFLDAMGDSYTDPVTAEAVQPWQQYCLAFTE
jgi:hypothetical protein